MSLNIKFYDTIARFYDAENIEMTDDLILYSELVEETGGPVLDVGCGTGRVMLHLAQEGVQTVGIDRSEAMLERGQRKLAVMPDLKSRVTFVQGDALNTPFAHRFKLIIVPYNGFMHFSEQVDQIAALRHFYSLLDDDGMLVLDLPNAGEAFGTQDDGSVVLERMFVEPETGHVVMQQSVSTLDRISQQLHITWIYDEISDDSTVHRTVAPLLLRYVFSGEMNLLLKLTGLEAVQIYGDYMRDPFVEGCPRMIVLARKAPEIGKREGK
ncbi:MAG: class I SAM-dependent methyltransferase [Chloroflexi bacterium]|nr:class I SAM-dependent methyltransferase [Chloroflexota bacterium]